MWAFSLGILNQCKNATLSILSSVLLQSKMSFLTQMCRLIMPLLASSKHPECVWILDSHGCPAWNGAGCFVSCQSLCGSGLFQHIRWDIGSDLDLGTLELITLEIVVHAFCICSSCDVNFIILPVHKGLPGFIVDSCVHIFLTVLTVPSPCLQAATLSGNTVRGVLLQSIYVWVIYHRGSTRTQKLLNSQ